MCTWFGGFNTTGHKVHAEIVARIGQMRTAFTKFKKMVYGNRSIPKAKRVRILGTHVLSILRYVAILTGEGLAIIPWGSDGSL